MMDWEVYRSNVRNAKLRVVLDSHEVGTGGKRIHNLYARSNVKVVDLPDFDLSDPLYYDNLDSQIGLLLEELESYKVSYLFYMWKYHKLAKIGSFLTVVGVLFGIVVNAQQIISILWPDDLCPELIEPYIGDAESESVVIGVASIRGERGDLLEVTNSLSRNRPDNRFDDYLHGIALPNYEELISIHQSDQQILSSCDALDVLIQLGPIEKVDNQNVRFYVESVEPPSRDYFDKYGLTFSEKDWFDYYEKSSSEIISRFSNFERNCLCVLALSISEKFREKYGKTSEFEKSFEMSDAQTRCRTQFVKSMELQLVRNVESPGFLDEVEIDEIVRSYRQIQESTPSEQLPRNWLRVPFHLGLIFEETGQKDSAIRFFSDYISNDGDNLRVRLERYENSRSLIVDESSWSSLDLTRQYKILRDNIEDCKLLKSDEEYSSFVKGECPEDLLARYTAGPLYDSISSWQDYPLRDSSWRVLLSSFNEILIRFPFIEKSNTNLVNGDIDRKHLVQIKRIFDAFSVRDLSIHGHASREGNLRYNNVLSHERAMQLNEYLRISDANVIGDGIQYSLNLGLSMDRRAEIVAQVSP